MLLLNIENESLGILDLFKKSSPFPIGDLPCEGLSDDLRCGTEIALIFVLS